MSKRNFSRVSYDHSWQKPTNATPYKWCDSYRAHVASAVKTATHSAPPVPCDAWDFDKLPPKVKALIVRHHDDCWEWHGETLDSGYPTLFHNFKDIAVRRLVYETYVGKHFPKENRVYMDCPLMDCLNPEHMRLSL